MKLLLPDLNIPSPLEIVNHPALKSKNISLYAKRDDKIHPDFSGNKYRKLLFNIKYFKENKFATFITFGGAYSNHLHASSFLTKYFSIPTIGIVRGESEYITNPTLTECVRNGMKLHFVDRQSYVFKENDPKIRNLFSLYPNHYLVPEGGSNTLALKGVCEIWDELYHQLPQPPDYVFCACGTGATVAGLLAGAPIKTTILAFPVLKFNQFEQEILQYSTLLKSEQLVVDHSYHFGGYAKTNQELVEFADDFRMKTQIALDYVYNAKAVFGFFDLLKKGFFKQGSSVVWINTGGLQGNRGFKNSE